MSNFTGIFRMEGRAVAIICALALLLGASLQGCKQDEAAVEATSKPRSHWVFERSEPRQIAVVFVHGIFGDSVQTWTHANGTRFFDLVRRAKGIGEKVDVYTFDYASAYVGNGSLSIDEASNKIEQTLEDEGIWDYDQVVFVAHSMGGLVLMHQLTMNPERAQRVPLLVLYATPQEGSQITSIARHLSGNDALRQMLLIDGNDFLREVNNRWIAFKSRGLAPPVVCAYEKKPTMGVMIVPWSSASRFCDEVPSAIENSDHISIVKPADASGSAAVVFRNAMRKHVMSSLDPSAWEVSGVDTSEERWSFDLREVNDFNYFTVANKSKARQTLRALQSDPALYVPTEHAARVLRSGESHRVGVFVLGKLKRDYEFTMRLGMQPPKTVQVLVLNYEEAVDARLAREAGRAGRLANLIQAERNAGRFDQLTQAQQRTRLSELAFQTASEESPTAPEEIRWMLAAGTLSKFSQASTEQALAKAKENAGDTRFAELSRSIAENVGGARLVPAVVEMSADSTPRVAVSSDADLQKWDRLSQELASMEKLERESFLLHGNLERAQIDGLQVYRFQDDPEGAAASNDSANEDNIP